MIDKLTLRLYSTICKYVWEIIKFRLESFDRNENT